MNDFGAIVGSIIFMTFESPLDIPVKNGEYFR
jgi:hypothetical protein